MGGIPGGGMSAGMGNPMGGAGQGAPGAENKSGRDDDADPANVTVELLGIIYIFNPPDKTKLHIEGSP
jgi:hypothetical protein